KIPGVVDLSNAKLCVNGHKATRIAYVIDNSSSNGDGKIGGRGTDPVRRGPKNISGDNLFTDRQLTVFNMIQRTVERDKRAFEVDGTFAGSAVGVAYFPNSQNHIQEYGKVSGSTVALANIIQETRGLV